MTFEKAIYNFPPSPNYMLLPHLHPIAPQCIPSYTQSQRDLLLVVLLSISPSPRGAHVLANPKRHVRSFVGRSQHFVHFVARFVCWRRRRG